MQRLKHNMYIHTVFVNPEVMKMFREGQYSCRLSHIFHKD